MAIFRFFQDGGRPPSWICNACVGTTHEEHAVDDDDWWRSSTSSRRYAQKIYNICLRAAYWTTVDNSRHYKNNLLADEKVLHLSATFKLSFRTIFCGTNRTVSCLHLTSIDMCASHGFVSYSWATCGFYRPVCLSLSYKICLWLKWSKSLSLLEDLVQN